MFSQPSGYLAKNKNGNQRRVFQLAVGVVAVGVVIVVDVVTIVVVVVVKI